MSKVDCIPYLRVGRVPGYANYRVLSSGSVWAHHGGCFVRLASFPDKYGYLQVNLSHRDRKRRFYLHALVLEAFVGPCPDGQECRHLDGCKTNNRLENLCWGTRAENCADSERHGTLLRGSRQASSKLTEADVIDIRSRARRGNQGMLAKEYGVSDTTISHIVNRRKWRHVS